MTLLTKEYLSQLRKEAAADSRLRLARNAITNVGAAKAALDRDRITALYPTTETKLDSLEVTDQKRSGRCWMFAAFNVFRHRAAQELNVDNFEFSFTYLQYFDKLERANLVLNQLLDKKDAGWDERTVAAVLDHAGADGGWWCFFSNLVAKYGVVPAEVMPEVRSSGHTAEMNRDLATVVRRAAALDGPREEVLAQAHKDIHRILAIHLGTPPEEFTWAYRTKDEQFVRLHSTPREFADKYLPRLDEFVVLADDPRSTNPKHRVFSSADESNVLGGAPQEYLNVTVEELKETAKRSLAAGEPVWFSCDVNRQFSFLNGVWDEGLVDTDGLYGIDSTMTKEERFTSGETAPTHAMALTGVDG
ncbi:aminopeptidase C, partial [Corynebacterium kefirresidentii]|uniref:aminopeptidase C n=1 Tax=Corynebacterium kefirresidentii TaxID=1979527 RepID=UPI003735E28F